MNDMSSEFNFATSSVNVCNIRALEKTTVSRSGMAQHVATDAGHRITVGTRTVAPASLLCLLLMRTSSGARARLLRETNVQVARRTLREAYSKVTSNGIRMQAD